MKTLKLLALSLLITISVSCNKDDENSGNSNIADLIVGTWRPIKEVDGCLNGSISESPYDECDQMSNIDFFENGLFTFGNLRFNENTGVCELVSNGEEVWEIVDDKLFITDEGQNQEITYFELQGNVLRTGFYDDEDCAGGYYYTEYNRD